MLCSTVRAHDAYLQIKHLHQLNNFCVLATANSKLTIRPVKLDKAPSLGSFGCCVFKSGCSVAVDVLFIVAHIVLWAYVIGLCFVMYT